MKLTKKIVLTEDFFVRDEDGVGYMYEPGDEIYVSYDAPEADEPIEEIPTEEAPVTVIDSFEGTEVVSPEVEAPVEEIPVEGDIEILDDDENKEVLIEDPFFSDAM